MPLSKLWVLAYRDLGRNRRRSLLTLLAVALGLALLLMMNGFIAGIFEDTLQNSIRLRTGHVQLRSASYNEDDLSLRWDDLLLEPEALAARASALPQVKAAAPVLWAGAIIATTADSVGMQLYGVDATSPIYDPIRASMVDGAFLTPDDRTGIVIGQHLAASLGLGVGRDVSLTVVDGDGQAHEGIFTIRGLFATGIPTYDEGAALMPLAKAQAFTATSRRASAVVILLHDQAATDAVVAALQGPDIAVRTWADLNQLFIQSMQTASAFYVVLDVIVFLVVAVIIANTLLMSVFERIREMGILSALGMKGRHITQMLMLEAGALGLAGIVVGMLLGLAVVGYLATVGFDIGRSASVGGSAMALSTTMRARFVPGTFAGLALATLGFTLAAALYPAWYASRLEPVEALRA